MLYDAICRPTRSRTFLESRAEPFAGSDVAYVPVEVGRSSTRPASRAIPAKMGLALRTRHFVHLARARRAHNTDRYSPTIFGAAALCYTKISKPADHPNIGAPGAEWARCAMKSPMKLVVTARSRILVIATASFRIARCSSARDDDQRFQSVAVASTVNKIDALYPINEYII